MTTTHSIQLCCYADYYYYHRDMAIETWVSMATALMQLFQIQDTNMTNCHRSYSCCHLPRRLWWLHLHCSYVDATFFTPFCFSSPSSQLFLIQDSNCQKNSYFCCHLPSLCWLHLYIHLPHYNYNHIRDQSYCFVWGVSYSCFLLPPAHSSCWHSRSYCYQLIITLSWLLTFKHHTAWLLLVVVPQRYGNWNWNLSLSLRQLWLQLCWCNFHALPKTNIQLFQIQDNCHSSYSCCQTISLWLHLHEITITSERSELLLQQLFLLPHQLFLLTYY